jgi:hypothetical protein
MSTLPVRPLATDTVTIDDVEIPIRALSRAEAVHLKTFRDGTETGDVDGAEVYLLVTSVGVSEDEAKAWRENTDSGTVQAVLERILRLSNLVEEGAPDPKSPGSEPS